MNPRFTLIASLLTLAIASGCNAANSGASGPSTDGTGGKGSPGNAEGPGGMAAPSSSAGGASSQGPGAGGTGAGGTSAGVDAGGPLGPSLPADPNGFQLTLAPLLDAQGCTECHHVSRPVDLTRYPFMAGAESAAADSLIASFTTTMPPAPRDKAPSTLVDRIVKWKADGMKP